MIGITECCVNDRYLIVMLLIGRKECGVTNWLKKCCVTER
jgi:hypothetical protein